MKKLLSLLIGILIFSMMFTACNTPAESPTDVEGKTEQTEEKLVQDVNSIKNIQESNKQQDVTSVDLKEEKEDKDFSAISSKEELQTTLSQDVDNQSDSTVVDIGTDLDPEFTKLSEMKNWLLSKDDNDQFSEDKKVVLSKMSDGNQIVYYQPTLREGNDLLKLDKIKVSGSTLIYFYHFVDKDYDDLQLKISCYMDDSFKDSYTEAVDDLEKQIYGFISAEVDGHQVLYRDNQHGVTSFRWQQFGGYIAASLKGENQADKVQEVLPYMNLEKVTLRTDLETQ